MVLEGTSFGEGLLAAPHKTGANQLQEAPFLFSLGHDMHVSCKRDQKKFDSPSAPARVSSANIQDIISSGGSDMMNAVA